MGSRHQEAALLASSNNIIFHFSQKTSRKMEIHQKISLRDLRALLPMLTEANQGHIIKGQLETAAAGRTIRDG